MGLNTPYESSNMDCSFSSEELSSEVLKALKSFISDDIINAAIITIPAKFKADQIAATKERQHLPVLNIANCCKNRLLLLWLTG